MKIDFDMKSLLVGFLFASILFVSLGASASQDNDNRWQLHQTVLGNEKESSVVVQTFVFDATNGSVYERKGDKWVFYGSPTESR